jgi:hypothetical protein
MEIALVPCPSCQFQTQPDWYFCPNCAKELREKPPVISVGKQIFMYLVSFFLTPLGLGWGIKYIKFKDQKTKTIGIICIVLTALSLIFMVMSVKSFIDQYGKMLNNLIPSY